MRFTWRLVVAVTCWLVVFASTPAEGAQGELERGSKGPAVEALQRRLNQMAGNVCLTRRCIDKFRVEVDGTFGPETEEAVMMFQAQNLLRRDGIVGPKTRAMLELPYKPCDATLAALKAAGASASEQRHGVAIAKRESGCHLAEWADRPSTGDFSWGPFQINFIGRLMTDRIAKYGHYTLQTLSWDHAVGTFLKFARTSGYCGWSRYCN